MSRPHLKLWQWIVLVLVLFTVVSWYVHRPDDRARQLNDILEATGSPQLKSYAYEFRVLRTEGATAVMSTPRNFDVPAFKMLGVLYPNLDVKNQNDPDFIKAEKALADAQFEAMTIVRTQPGINNVRWELDASWLRSHSIDVPDNALPRNR